MTDAEVKVPMERSLTRAGVIMVAEGFCFRRQFIDGICQLILDILLCPYLQLILELEGMAVVPSRAAKENVYVDRATHDIDISFNGRQQRTTPVSCLLSPLSCLLSPLSCLSSARASASYSFWWRTTVVDFGTRTFQKQIYFYYFT